MHAMMGDVRLLPDQSEVRATVLMEFIIDKLKLLSYERDFCFSRKPPWPRLHKLYFALPAHNRNEQFLYFINITSWLLRIIGRNFETPSEADDPNTTCTNISVELRDLGFAPPSWPPAKLKQGHGDAVCSVLDGLTSLALEIRKFQFQPPQNPCDNYPEESPKLGNDRVETTDELYVPDSEDAEASRVDEFTPDLDERKSSDSSFVVRSNVDPQKWRLELERVAPQLRVSVVADGKDWRAHLEQAHKLEGDMLASLTSNQDQLERVEMDVTSALEKLESRENFINAQFEPLAAEYAAVKSQISGIQEKHRRSLENVANLTQKLSQISDQLDHVKQLMVEKGNVISDLSPLVLMKSTTQKLKAEIRDMELQNGVLKNSLLQT
ncbi:intraflagellar transport protein 57 [Marchantia polymorpha subsp. ruderalis]|uniref:Intraflagellar transport protein 57 homolog n=1 Tax=Marchantia polymorpha TaxID=3197 RepID=A0A2R6XMQ2_MARPO|nr:hypothetical protein MARPO_0008s0156 [Marchantia polymorpha]BBN19436.1 hypothetical protein Mp_8g10670 [Marchantia polymorpha subsp. ruderalis]|eukprot:PTQ47397.1 hypothetical protein MARPO_0008s0156 [Marchantia polymorpha]